MQNNTLRSPGYPSRYPINIYCVYRVPIPFNQELIVYFKYFELEFHGSCRYTKLQLVCSELLLHESFHSAANCLPLLLLIQVLFHFRFFFLYRTDMIIYGSLMIAGTRLGRTAELKLVEGYGLSLLLLCCRLSQITLYDILDLS